MEPLLERAREYEERPRAEPVGDDLDHGALEGEPAARKEPEEHKTHMADARIRDEALHVVLGKREERAVEYPGNAERHEGHGRGGRLRREEGDRKTEQPVGPCLEQQAGKDDAARGRGLGVRVRQPGVERHGGELHEKGGEEPELQEGARPGAATGVWSRAS